MQIRLMCSQDIKLHRTEVYSLLNSCFQNTYKDSNKTLIDTKIDGLIIYLEEGKAYTLGAFVNNTMIGFLWGYPVTGPFETVFHIAYIAVAKNARRQGIGKILMEKIDCIVKELSLDHIELIVGNNNYDAIEFYNSIGYETNRLVLRKCVK